MATFACRILSPSGGAPTEMVEAPDRAAPVREKLRLGKTPARATPVRDGSANGSGTGVHAPVADYAPSGEAPMQVTQVFGGLSMGAVMSRAEMANFVRELSTAIMAGLPLVHALRTLARQGRSQRQKAMLGPIIEQ